MTINKEKNGSELVLTLEGRLDYDFLHAKKTRHIFCEAMLHEKSRYARQKALTGVFDGYNLT